MVSVGRVEQNYLDPKSISSSPPIELRECASWTAKWSYRRDCIDQSIRNQQHSPAMLSVPRLFDRSNISWKREVNDCDLD